MDQVDSVSFSAVIAGMLLYERNLNSKMIANMIAKLESKNLHVDDENDTLEDLQLCVAISCHIDFSLKKDLCYDTILYDNVNVYKFLVMHTDPIVLYFLGINCFDFEEEEDIDMDKISNNLQSLQKVLGIFSEFNKNGKQDQSHSISKGTYRRYND